MREGHLDGLLNGNAAGRQNACRDVDGLRF